MHILNQMNALYFYPHKIRFEPVEKHQGGRARRSAPAYSAPDYDYEEALAPFYVGCFQPPQAPAAKDAPQPLEEIQQDTAAGRMDDDGAPPVQAQDHPLHDDTHSSRR